MNYKAVFETTYEPGELVAIAYKDGDEAGRMSLKTSGKPEAIKIVPDRTEIKAGAEDISYLSISFVDSDGGWCRTQIKK